MNINEKRLNRGPIEDCNGEPGQEWDLIQDLSLKERERESASNGDGGKVPVARFDQLFMND